MTDESSGLNQPSEQLENSVWVKYNPNTQETIPAASISICYGLVRGMIISSPQIVDWASRDYESASGQYPSL